MEKGNNSANILFIVDVSKSMNVLDIDNKNTKISRWDASKNLINNFITLHNNYSYGLMVFAGEAVELLPFTNDLNIFKTIFLGINENNVSKTGTNFFEVFSGIVSFFSWETEAGTVVIFTDWWDEINDSDLQDIIKKIKEKDINIIIVWVGTESWDRIPIGTDTFWKNRYKIYEGKEVISKLNIEGLKNFSKNNKFSFIHLENTEDFDILEKKIQENLIFTSGIYNSSQRKMTREFIFISFILFFIFLWWEYKRNRNK